MNASLVGLGLAVMLAVHVPAAHASVVISGTRVVYAEPAQEVTVKMTNAGGKPALVQAWIDDGDENATPATAKAPFTLTPPVFRLEPQKGQSLRVFRSSTVPAADRESVYWLNVLDVPPKVKDSEAENRLQFAFRSRIKFFYRPAGLPYAVEEAPAKLVLTSPSAGASTLTLHNPTPYHITYVRLVQPNPGQERVLSDTTNMVAPGSSTPIDVTAAADLTVGSQVQLEYIDDFGAQRAVLLTLSR